MPAAAAITSQPLALPGGFWQLRIPYGTGRYTIFRTSSTVV